MKGSDITNIWVWIIIAIVILVASIALVTPLGAQAKAPLYENSLRTCCPNYCSNGVAADCTVPTQFEADGKMTAEALAIKAGYVDGAGNVDTERLGTLCSCSG